MVVSKSLGTNGAAGIGWDFDPDQRQVGSLNNGQAHLKDTELVNSSHFYLNDRLG